MLIVFHQPPRDFREGHVFQRLKGEVDDLDSVAMPLGYEWRQKRKGLLAERAIEPLYWQGIFLPEGNQTSHVAPMPPEVARLATPLAMIGFGQAALPHLHQVGIHLLFDDHTMSVTREVI